MALLADTSIPRRSFDVAVIGGGAAGLAAALTAVDGGRNVVLLEKAPPGERGGNTRFSDAQMRFPHSPDEFCAKGYTQEEFRDDLMRLSRGRANPQLVQTLVANAAAAADWLTALGLAWEEGFPHVSSYRRHPLGGGRSIVDLLHSHLERRSVPILYETAAQELLLDQGGAVVGVRALGPDGLVDILARATVLATGGFQANLEMRVAYLGRHADRLILRGSRHDSGEGIRMALAIGAQAAGQWGDYHSAVIDARSPSLECGVTGLYNYQMGIIVDGQGQRFLDEGADFRDHTYVLYGKAIIEQAGGLAFSLFDQRMVNRPEFQRAWRPVAPPTAADSIEELALKLDLPAEALSHTVREFNAAVQPGQVDLDRLDGVGTRGISPPKSNWAQPLQVPPFVAVPVSGGITFTFGGLKTDSEARVIDRAGRPIPGLFAAGEMVGEFFYDNYPGAASVIRCLVFGRIAGRNAASLA